MNQKVTQEDHQTNHQQREPPVKTYTKTKPKATTKANPKHDTETVSNDDPDFWKEQNLGLIKDQLGKRNFKHTKILMEVE